MGRFFLLVFLRLWAWCEVGVGWEECIQQTRMALERITTALSCDLLEESSVSTTSVENSGNSNMQSVDYASPILGRVSRLAYLHIIFTNHFSVTSSSALVG